ncbi:MAG TPA: hypothetical protein VHY37_12440 [Tepidisphaeraceae bacterium]|nr:hypothetical protein [Tepidisphaeraceae bacterium]
MQVHLMEHQSGPIDEIVSKASNGLERAIVSGKITSRDISRRLNRGLGANWIVKTATLNGVVNIIAARTSA